jgi:hypothetical protein
VYAFAQLCAFWVRRAVLAAATALIGGIVLGLWHVVAVAADVPLAWAAWAFTIACFSATWAMSARWMHEDRHWTTRAFKVGWIVLPLLLVVIGARQYRATQVPLVDPGFDWQQRDREFREFDRPWSARWQSLQADLNVHGAHASGNDPGQAAERRGADRVARMRSALLELSEELDTRHGRLDPRSFGPLTGFPAFWLGRVAAEAAAEEGEQGRLNEAWRFQQAGERTTRYLAQQAASWGDWTGCLSAHDAVLNSIRTWAAHGDQTPASLGAALAFLQSGAAPTTAEEMFKNRYVLWRRIFEGRLRTDEDFESDPFPGAARRHLAWSGDLQRTQRLMAVITRPSLPVRLEFPGQPDTAAVPPETVSRWIAATPFLPHDFWSDAGTGTGLHARVDERFQLSLAEHGGTLLVLALHAWRLDHGEFPERLEQLTPDYVSHLPRDPFSTGGAGDYGYRRDGFPAKVLTSALHEVPAHQPLLWSAGPGGGHIVYNDRSQPSGAIPPWWYYATNYARWVTAREMGAPTTAGGLADPTRVRFVILGQPFPAGSIGSAPSPDESR